MSLPSLRGLRAFAEATRAGSLAGAARSLNVTPSAVSHLLAELQSGLGVDLARTEAGERFGQRLIAAFDEIAAVVQDVRQQAGDVRVSALSSFLTLWLVPRLAGFQAQHPDIRLLLSTGLRPVDLVVEPFDCAIRWGAGGWKGLEATLLFRDEPVAVANPRLLQSGGDPATLPRLAARTREQDWPLVAAALGWPSQAAVLTLETRALAVQAAMAGIGAAVVDRNLVTGLLRDGLLAEIAPVPPVTVPEGHWFVALPSRTGQAPVRRFRDWLVANASAAAVSFRTV